MIYNNIKIPDGLLHEHTKGNVVFFCGAGISIPAGFPDFEELTERVIKDLGQSKQKDSYMQSLMDIGDYISIFETLETRHGKETIREKVKKHLKIEPKVNSLHENLYKLSKTKNNKYRLVTTNFDNLFDKVKGDGIHEYKAPALPIPENDWNGIVYLHGKLSQDDTKDNLVLSNTDFGNAYLYEQWATRFLIKLFQNHTVCFIGYSLDDPIMRYMIDASASQKVKNKMYLFVGHQNNDETKNITSGNWKNNKIEIISYDKKNNHLALEETIQAWATDFTDEVNTLISYVDNYVDKKKNGALQQEDIDGFLWAMSESSGDISKHFSDIKPTPQWECIDELTSHYFTEEHFNRFGIEKEQSSSSHPEELKFSLLFRPIATGENVWYDNRILPYKDKILKNLINWMILNINNEDMFKWVVDHNFTPNDFINLLKDSVYKIPRCSFTEAKKKLKESPHSILSERMRNFWILFLNDKFAIYNYYEEEELLKNSKDINIIKILLKTLITPRLKMTEGLNLKFYTEISIPINPRTRHNGNKLMEDLLKEKELHLLLNVFTNALDETIVLHTLSKTWRELDMDIRSINEHEQNKYSASWYSIIRGIVLCWEDLRKKDIDTARSHTEKWWSSELTIYKRLALYTAQNDNVIDTSKAIDWLESYQQNHWKKEYNDLRGKLKDRESISEANKSRINELQKGNSFPVWGSDGWVSEYENAVKYPDTGEAILQLLKSNTVKPEQFSYNKYDGVYKKGWEQYIYQNSEDKILAVLEGIKDSEYFIPLYSTLIYQITYKNNKFTKSIDKLLDLIKIIPLPQKFKNSNFIHELWYFFDWLTTKHIAACPDIIEYGKIHIETLNNNTEETSPPDDHLLNTLLNSTIGKIVLTLEQYSHDAKNKKGLSLDIQLIISNILESDDKSDGWAVVGSIFRNLYIMDREWAETLIKPSDDEKKINHIMYGIMATGNASRDFSEFIFPILEKYIDNNTYKNVNDLGSWIFEVSDLYVNKKPEAIEEDKLLDIYRKLDEETITEILFRIKENAENTNDDERRNFIKKTAIPILDLMPKDNAFKNESAVITDLCLVDNTENHELYEYLDPHLNEIAVQKIKYHIEKHDTNSAIVLALLNKIPNEKLIENSNVPKILETLKNNNADIINDLIYKELKAIKSN